MKLINVLIPKDRITENYHCLTLIRWGETWWFQIVASFARMKAYRDK